MMTLVILVKIGDTCKTGSHLEKLLATKKNGSHIDPPDMEIPVKPGILDHRWKSGLLLE